jgi:hypothetical protein
MARLKSWLSYAGIALCLVNATWNADRYLFAKESHEMFEKIGLLDVEAHASSLSRQLEGHPNQALLTQTLRGTFEASNALYSAFEVALYTQRQHSLIAAFCWLAAGALFLLLQGVRRDKSPSQ